MLLTLCPSSSSWCEKESSLSLCEACMMPTLKTGTVEQVAGSLAPAFLDRKVSCIATFHAYKAVNITLQVVDQLLQG